MNLSLAVKSGVAIALATALGISYASAEAVSDDQPARVEFRILADTKHDRAAAEKAKELEAVDHPPAGYRWIWLGNLVTGSSPTIGPKSVTVPGALGGRRVRRWDGQVDRQEPRRLRPREKLRDQQ